MLITSIPLILFIFSCSNAFKPKNCGQLGNIFNAKTLNSIIGGDDIDVHQVPWVVRVNAGNSLCTGTLISNRHVLTAGHCLAPGKCKSFFDPEKDYICYMTSSNDKECERKYYIKEVHLLDRYLNSHCDRSLDIVVLELMKPIKKAIPICLPIHGNGRLLYRTNDPADAYLVGFSFNDDLDLFPERENKHLRYGTAFPFMIQEDGVSFIATEYDPSTVAICGGDSGGPMFEIHKKNKAVLVGVNIEADGDCVINDVETKKKKPLQYSVEVKQHLKDILAILR